MESHLLTPRTLDPLRSRATLAARRKIGAYYTPQSVTDTLSEWAIRSPTDLVLEPGFGGCGFLESSAKRLKALGCTEPSARLFGCDIDDHAFRILHTRLGLTQLSGHFLLGDFLSIRPDAFVAEAFDVAIGNPPYIRHHHIVGDQKTFARAIRDRMLPSLNLQASLWAHFVLHACEFLKVGGRAAWILPSSFAYAYYAKALRAFMDKNFASVVVVGLDERLFEAEGAAESTVVVAAEGWKHGCTTRGAPRLMVRARSVDELGDRLLSAAFANNLASEPQTEFNELFIRSRPLGDFCKLSIGIVTGDAAFFLFNREKAEVKNIREINLVPIVSRARLVSGLSVSTKDLKTAFEKGAASMILDTRGRQSAAMKRYLQSISKKRIKQNLTFGKRHIWHRPLDNKKSEAFFTCMSHYGPRLVLNRDRTVTCTNTLYRAAFRKGVTVDVRKTICLALASSFGQLSAEYHGRCYGAGMLKHEPSDAEAIRLLVPASAGAHEISVAFKLVDALLKAKKDTAARLEADKFFVSTGTLSDDQCRSIRDALSRVRAVRWQSRPEK